MKKGISKGRGKSGNRRVKDISRWTTEELEREVVEDLPPNPLLERFIRLIFEHDNAPPALFHYTRPEAAKNILRTRSVWAFDAYGLADSREIAYPCGLLRKEIRSRERKFRRQDQRLCADLCSALGKALVTPQDCYPAVFVFCLTENTGSKRHWKEYSSHEGYALAFKLRTPETLGLFVAQGRNAAIRADAVLRKVVYDPKLQRRMLAAVIDTFVELFSDTMVKEIGADPSEPLPGYFAKSFVENFKDFASRVIVSIKHPSFRREREWRVIVAPMPGVLEDDFRRSTNWFKTRKIGGKKRKYAVLLPIKRERLPLCGMVAGRDCNADGKKAISRALRKAGYLIDLKNFGGMPSSG